MAVRIATLAEMDAATIYRIARLREEVFCLEQGAADADLDGRELEPTTRLVWIEDAAGEPVAHARVLVDPGSMRIGRMAVHRDRRRDGLGRCVMETAIALCERIAPAQEIRIDAQAYLESWYASMGFVTVSEPFDEAGILHVAMTRPPRS